MKTEMKAASRDGISNKEDPTFSVNVVNSIHDTASKDNMSVNRSKTEEIYILLILPTK